MEINAGMIIEGRITGITKFGMFVDFGENRKGLVHISEISEKYIKEISDLYKLNDTVKVKVLSVENQTDKISLSIKQIYSDGTFPKEKKEKRDYNDSVSIKKIPDEYNSFQKSKPTDFEEMMERYKKQSSEKLSDAKKSIESKQNGYSKRNAGKPK